MKNGSISIRILILTTGFFVLGISLIYIYNLMLVGDIRNEEFRDQIKYVQEWNKGLSVKTRPSVFNTPSTTPRLVDIVFFNRTGEAVIFTSADFGVEVYQFDETQHNWIKVETLMIPGSNPFILPVEIDVEGKFIWLFDENLLLGVNRNHSVRLFFTGKGEQSGKNYGTFVDLPLSK